MNSNYKLLLLSASFSFFIHCSSDEKKITDSTAPIAVTLNQSENSTDLSSVTASGKLVAKNTVNVSTRMMGYITGIKAEVGQNVSQGQLLVSINNTDIQAKGGQASAQISQAQANYNLAKKDYERFQNLYKVQSASQKELDDMRARYEMASASLQAAQQMKNEVNAQYRYTNITSPISGVVTATYAKTGDMASPGMPILTIEAPSVLQAQVLLSEDDITLVHQGMPVKILLKTTGQEVGGTVAEVSLSATNTGGQYMVKVNVPADKSLLPGMYVNVAFPIKRNGKVNSEFHNVVTVPKSALIEQGQLTGLYTVSKDNTAILRWVKTGKSQGNEVEILSGLSPNEKYVISADGKLYNGAKISIK